MTTGNQNFNLVANLHMYQSIRHYITSIYIHTNIAVRYPNLICKHTTSWGHFEPISTHTISSSTAGYTQLFIHITSFLHPWDSLAVLAKPFYHMATARHLVTPGGCRVQVYILTTGVCIYSPTVVYSTDILSVLTIRCGNQYIYYIYTHTHTHAY